MKGKKCLILALFLAFLCACGAQDEYSGFKVWFPTEPDPSQPFAQALSWEAFDEEKTPTVDTLMEALLCGPVYDELSAPFLPGTRLLRWSVEDGLLRLDFSAPYAELTGISLTLADYCITLTMCQLEGVEQVCITVNGQELAGREGRCLTPEDVIFTGAEEEPRLVEAELYFPRAVGKGLGFEKRELTLTEDDDLYTIMAQLLMAGPEDADLRAILPEGVELRGAWVDDGICYVNFSAALLDFASQPEEEQRLLLYSLVDTMGNLSSVTAVQLLVEDEIVPQFGGQDTSLPLEPDFGLVGSMNRD